MKDKILNILETNDKAFTIYELKDVLCINTTDELESLIKTLNELENDLTIYHTNKDKYMGFKYNLKYLTYIGILISKIIRCIFLLVKKNHVCRIFGAHGSFVILSRKAVNRLYPIYDENIFLFAEESVLAMKARKANLLTCYYPKISINHKEDGSMKLSNLVLNDELKKANIYYYEHYVL